MIKLKTIIKEGLHGKFWWMSPQGKLYRIMKIDAVEGHREAAIEILKSMGIEPGDDVWRQMYDLGWLRLGFVGNEAYYTLSFTNHGTEPSARQMDSLKDLATELRADELVNMLTRQRYPFGNWE